MPLITVLMPVYNAEKYLREAIESILCQTFSDFDFLIINDGSNDSSIEIINSFEDKRIKLVHNKKNIKIAETLNKGLYLAGGKYIARMDADDISHHQRLEKQFRFMEDNPVVGICGTWFKTFNSSDNKNVEQPINHDEIEFISMFHNCLAHPSVLMRNELIKKNNLEYKSNYVPAEDYKFWSESVKCFKLANIPEFLLDYRLPEKIEISIYEQNKIEMANRVKKDILKDNNLNLNEKQIDLFVKYTNSNYCNNKDLQQLIKIYSAVFNLFCNKKPLNKDFYLEFLSGKLAYRFKRCMDLTIETMEMFEKTIFYNKLVSLEFKNGLWQRAIIVTKDLQGN